jgi:hypothetical protein
MKKLVSSKGQKYVYDMTKKLLIDESTYIRKDFFDLAPELNETELPTDGLDFRNHPDTEDFDLNFYPFVNREKMDKNLLIPRIIHQTSGFKKDELPQEIVDNINRLKDMNHGWEYRYYDNDDCIEFIKDNYDQETFDLYLSINPKFGQARADFFRYLLMYKEGGVYLDIKSTTLSPLDNILKSSDEYLLCNWGSKDWADIIGNKNGEFQNWHIICIPNHPFLKKTIETVKTNIINYNPKNIPKLKGVDTKKTNVLFTTGPIAYSKSILSLIDNYKNSDKIREFIYDTNFQLEYSFFRLENDSIYKGTSSDKHHTLYNGYSDSELIIKKVNNKK